MRDLREIGPTHRAAGAAGLGADRRRRARPDHGRRPADPAPVRLGGRARVAASRPAAGIGWPTCSCSRPCATGWASPG